MRASILVMALCVAIPHAFADNNPNKGPPAPSIEKKEVQSAQRAYDKAVTTTNANRINRTAAELAAAQARCGNPCN